MSDLIGPTVWDKFRKAINDAHDTFNQQTITWRRSQGSLDRNGEKEGDPYVDVPLLVLVDYNSFRKWPTDQMTETGDLDRQTQVLFLNRKYLSDNNWINANGNFDYDPAADRFICKGISYKASGDTDLSQAYNNPVLFQIVLQREETATGSKQN